MLFRKTVPLRITLVLDSGSTLSPTQLYPHPWAEDTKRPAKGQPEKMLGGGGEPNYQVNTFLPKNSEVDSVEKQNSTE